MTVEQRQALVRVYLYASAPLGPYERELCKRLIDQKGRAIAKEGEEDTEREGGTNTDINIEEDIVEDGNGGSLL